MKINTAFLLLVILLCLSGPANATLIDRGTGMIYDTALGITWLQDANYAQTSGYDADGRMTWDEANTWAASLDFGGNQDWRLPKTLPLNGSTYIYPSQDFYDGSGDIGGYNISSPGTVYEKSKASEFAYLYYNSLKNAGAFDLNGNFNPNWSQLQAGPFLGVQLSKYWAGTEYVSLPGTAFSFHTDGGQNINWTYEEHFPWAVRDGDYGPSVSTSQTYLTDYLTLGDTFTFDHWWEMGMEPTGFNLDVLFFNEENWETFGWELNFGGSSNHWETSTFWVPPWAQGETTRIMFSLFDGGQQTDPTVYLRNIGSSSAPVPEPSTILLMGLGLVALVGLRKKN